MSHSTIVAVVVVAVVALGYVAYLKYVKKKDAATPSVYVGPPPGTVVPPAGPDSTNPLPPDNPPAAGTP